MAADQGQFFERFLQTNFEGYYGWSACHVLAPDLENLLQHECATLKVVGRILTCSKSFLLAVYFFSVKCCMTDNSKKFFVILRSQVKFAITVNLKRWEDADVLLL